jgi:hypothetical protein
MSRSFWALTKHKVSAGAERPGRREQRGSLRSIFASSTKKYLLAILIVAGLVKLAAMPTCTQSRRLATATRRRLSHAISPCWHSVPAMRVRTVPGGSVPCSVAWPVRASRLGLSTGCTVR